MKPVQGPQYTIYQIKTSSYISRVIVECSGELYWYEGLSLSKYFTSF